MASISSITMEIDRLLGLNKLSGNAGTKSTETSDQIKRPHKHGGRSNEINGSSSCVNIRPVNFGRPPLLLEEGKRPRDWSSNDKMRSTRGVLFNGVEDSLIPSGSGGSYKMQNRGSSIPNSRQWNFMGIPITTNASEASLEEVAMHFSGKLLDDILADLSGFEEDRILIVRRCHKLGFKSPLILTAFLKRLLQINVKLIHLLPARVRNGRDTLEHLRPSSVAFVVFERVLPKELVVSLTKQTEVLISGAVISIQRFVSVPSSRPLNGKDEHGRNTLYSEERVGKYGGDHLNGRKVSAETAHRAGYENTYFLRNPRSERGSHTQPIRAGASGRFPPGGVNGRKSNFNQLITVADIAKNTGGQIGEALTKFQEITAPLQASEQQQLELLLEALLSFSDPPCSESPVEVSSGSLQLS